MRYSQKKKAPPTTRISSTATIHLTLNLGISLLFGVWDALNWRTGGDGAVHEASSPLPDRLLRSPAVWCSWQAASERKSSASGPAGEKIRDVWLEKRPLSAEDSRRDSSLPRFPQSQLLSALSRQAAGTSGERFFKIKRYKEKKKRPRGSSVVTKWWVLGNNCLSVLLLSMVILLCSGVMY